MIYRNVVSWNFLQQKAMTWALTSHTECYWHLSTKTFPQFQFPLFERSLLVHLNISFCQRQEIILLHILNLPHSLWCVVQLKFRLCKEGNTCSPIWKVVSSFPSGKYIFIYRASCLVKPQTKSKLLKYFLQ